MNASELMLGDWVLLNKKPCKVVELGYTNNFISVDFFQLPQDTINPVPITEKILLYSGFIKVNENDFELYPTDKTMGWIVKISKVSNTSTLYRLDTFGCIHNGLVEYVHELQQALRFDGITYADKLVC